jgi:predicted ATPase/DNA-binding SARP family transcriptional activator/Tfp pilus assembly protein PilF
MALMAEAEVRVLGPVEVAGDGGAVVSLAAKQLRLLTALVVAAGRTCEVDELVDAVWGESPPASARSLVQVYVSQLRKALPDGIEVVTRRGAYAVELAPEQLDAARFERLLGECGTARRTGNPALAASLADRAIGLWRGRAYGDLAYEEVASRESERLEELRLVAVEERIDAELDLGHHEEVLAEVLRVAGEHPYRERLQGQAMVALYRCGRQSEALEHYAAVRARLREEVGLDPGPALRELQRRILQHDPDLVPAPESAPAAVRLPAPPTPLVGRQRELDELRALLDRRDARLITLTGAGGSGKTRLAFEAARRVAGSFANGVAVAELAPLRDHALVLPTIARALGVADDPDEERLETLAAALAPQELLLVVDNAEHLREAAPSFAQLVARAPRLTLLVTSRVVLHVSGERVFSVAPLAEDDAVDLFVQRARLLDPSFAHTPDVETDMREICRRVDCLPLAIELAAARVRTLSPHALLKRLETRLGLLTGGPRDLPARQRTLRETIAWSVDLLDEEERRTFARLSVFPAGASLDTAERVCDASLDTISALVDHHLVQRAERAGRQRLMLLETIHEYAAGLLEADAAELELARRGHAEWCQALVDEAAPHLSGDRQSEWLDVLEAEHDSLRAALDYLHYLHEAGGRELELALAVPLSRFWYVRGYVVEGRRRLEGALESAQDQPPDERRRAFTAAASLALLQGDYDAARRLAEDALEAARANGEPRLLANAFSNLGAIVLAAGDYERAEPALEEAVRLARESGDERIAALAINNLGDLALTNGDYERAGPLFEESLGLLRTLSDTANIARSLFNNGAVDLMQGRLAAATERFRESLTLSRLTGDQEDTAWSLLGLAATDVEDGNGARGAVLLGAARGVLAQMHAAFKPFERELDRRTEERSRALSGDRQHDAGVAQGLSMTLDEALEVALGVSGSRGA